MAKWQRPHRRKSKQRNFDDKEYVAWRQAVRKRDNHKCQWPGCCETKGLNVHHIIRWADNHALRYNIYNGITLCKAHHKMINGNETVYVGLFQKIVQSKNK